MKIKTLFLALLGLIFGCSEIYAQNYGPELLTRNNFGTTADGINTVNLYPNITSANLDSVYSQPPTLVYVNNKTLNSTSPPPQNISINPAVTVAPPLPAGQTYYRFGFTEPKYSNLYSFLKKNGSNSAVPIPMAPTDGYYVVATSTAGMYSPPTAGSGGISWYTIYDRYETNIADPTNYFLIFNSDAVINKAFYKQKIKVTPGQAYRMSADYARLNSGGSPPELGFIVMTSSGNNATDSVNLRSAAPNARTGNLQDNGGQWRTIAFDYVAPCTADSVWIAFVNLDNGQNGNDLALDNLSLREILLQTTVNIFGDCSQITLSAVVGLQTSSSYTFAWYKEGNLTSIGSGQTITISTSDGTYPGNYYYTVSASSTNLCPMRAPSITINAMDVVNCNNIPTICAVDDAIQAIPGIIVSDNIISNDCNNNTCGTVGCPSDNLQVLQFAILTGFGINPSVGTYSPGTPVVITDNAGNTVGVLTIATNGDLTFQEVPNYTGTLDVIELPYTIVHTATGATATANVHIDLRLSNYTYTAQASCAGYPVTVVFTALAFSNDDFINNVTGQPYLPNNPTAGVDSVAYRYYLVNTNTMDVISDRTAAYYNATFSIERDPVNPSAGGSITIQFVERLAGLNSYQLRKKEPYNAPNLNADDTLRLLSVRVCPNWAIWNGATTANPTSWTNSDNWAANGMGGFPIWCTDVTIPGDSLMDYFPIINKGTDACRDIIFESGASVGKIQDLIYRSAYVQYQPPGFDNKWTMISAPLKYIYSADFQSDPSWGSHAFTDIKSYMSYFDMAFSDNNAPNPDGVTGTYLGSFSRPFANLKQELSAGFGFASNVVFTNGGGTTFTHDSTFYLPRFIPYGNAKFFQDLATILREVTYSYHYTDNGEWVSSHPNPNFNPFVLPRGTVAGSGVGATGKTTDIIWNSYFENQQGPVWTINPLAGQDSRYRFVYEDSKYDYDANAGTFTVTLSAIGNTRIVGNPLMSHLDFDVFYDVNQSNIQPYYRIWDGTSFYTYVVPPNLYDNSVWVGMDNLSTDPEITNGSLNLRYIAPMQAFFVDVTNENSPLVLNFNTAMSTARASGGTSNNRLRSGRQSVNENLLKLHLKMNEIETIALLASLSGASDSYIPGEDIYKLFSYNAATPEIYTISDKTAIEINAVSQDGAQKLIPIGIKTNQTGQFEISIEGVANFTAYEKVFLRDVLENKNYDLRKKASFTFDKTSQENLEGRFYIFLSSEQLATELPVVDNQDIVIIRESDGVRVYSPIDAIESFEIYDVSGRLLFKEAKIGASTYLWNSRLEQGIYVVNVLAGKSKKAQKIKW